MLEQNNSRADVWYLLGGAYSCLGNEEKAADCLATAADFEPCNLEYRLAYAGSLLRLEKNSAAEKEYTRLTEAYPELALGWYGRGRAYEKLASYAESLVCYERSLQLDNDYLPACIGAGSVLLELGLRERAREIFIRLLSSGEAAYEANVGIGLSLIPEEYNSADKYFAAALEVNPVGAAAYAGLSVVCKYRQDLQKALEYGRKAVEYGSNDSRILYDYAILLREAGRHREAAETLQRAHNQSPENPQFFSGLLLTLQYFKAVNRKELSDLHKLYGVKYDAGAEASAGLVDFINVNKPRLKLGFVSADLCLHPVGLFLLPILETLNKDRFEIFLYSNTSKNDQISRRLMAVSDHAVSILSMADRDAVEYIRRDGVDILFDLGGHTPNSRLGIFIRRAAPLQVTWLGYPDTAGVKNIDYRLVDHITDPQEDSACMVEKPLYLGRCFLAYKSDSRLERYQPAPGITNGYITFGSFNNFAKFSAETYCMFSRILQLVPSAKLLLKSAGLGQDWVQEQIYDKFAEYGIGRERLLLQNKTDNYLEHMNTYAKIDIALDTYPYNGTTTTCDALWMGVPVVTFLGESHVSRVSGSLLIHSGMEELAGNSVEEYIAIAVKLAGDMSRIEEYRRNMAEKITPIIDLDGYASAFETALVKIAAEYQGKA